MYLLQVSDQQEFLKVVFGYGVSSFVNHLAVDGSDYAGQSNVLLTFNASSRSREVPVNLTDDSVYEGDEDFSGTLTLESTSPRVTIDPEKVLATIEDNKGMKTTFTDKKQISCLRKRRSWLLYKYTVSLQT